MREGAGLVAGTVDAEVAADFPDLSVWSIHCPMPPKGTSRRVARRLAALDDRLFGVATGSLRNDHVAGRYRSFARQVGLDPDVERNALDEAAVTRLLRGHFAADRRLDQALLVGMLETKVPLWCLDGDEVHGWLSVSVAGGGALWVSDERRALAPVLASPPRTLRPDDRSARAVVYAFGVAGVPESTVEEAFWQVRDCLQPDG